MENFHDQYVSIVNTPDHRRVELWSLVLLSAGIANKIKYRSPDYQLQVLEFQADEAFAEIEHFEDENLNWPPPKKGSDELTDENKRPPTVILMGGLLVLYQFTGPFSLTSIWFSRGAIDSRAIIENGEWWRLVTALTLHSGPVHLLGNLLIGGLIIHYLCKMFGTGLGWFAMIIAGTLGNLVNVLARGEGHISVGFSTAVFAAIGLLCGGQLRLGNLRSILLPLGAGVSLLAMLGSSGQRTDLGAHLWGLIVGLIMGTALRRSGKILHDGLSAIKQIVLLILAVLIVWLAWSKALAV